MNRLTYTTGEDVRQGDRVRYHGEPGEVEFVITQASGDGSKDWYLEQCPEGGLMVNASGFGRVFLKTTDVDEDFELVSRSSNR